MKIFVSYSHRNSDWVSDTGKYPLIPWLKEQLVGQADIWTDHALKQMLGEDYSKLITAKINEADIAILLISQEFARPGYIHEVEMPLMKERYNRGELKIIPLLISGLSKNGKENVSWIFDLQTYPNDTKPLLCFVNDDAKWAEIRVDILDAIEAKIEQINELQISKKSPKQISTVKSKKEVILPNDKIKPNNVSQIDNDKPHLNRRHKKNIQENRIIRGKNSGKKYWNFIGLIIFIIGVSFIMINWLGSPKNSIVHDIVLPINVDSVKTDKKVKDSVVLPKSNIKDDEKTTIKTSKKKKGRLRPVKKTSGLNTKKDNAKSMNPTKTLSRLDVIKEIDRNMILIKGKSIEWEDPNDTTIKDEGAAPNILKRSAETFMISKFEVTQEQWKVIMGYNPSFFKGENLPVESITLSEVKSFINLINKISGKKYRLPEPEEWELAAYAKFWTFENFIKEEEDKNKYISPKHVWYEVNSKRMTHSVGMKRPNINSLYDIFGNVWEMVNSDFDNGKWSLLACGGGFNSNINRIDVESETYERKTDSKVENTKKWHFDANSFQLLTSTKVNDKKNFVGLRLARSLD